MGHHPDIFISTTSADLRSARQLMRDALLRFGAHPIVQEHFEPAGSTVRQMLTERLQGCDAVIHVVGECAGAEPREHSAESPRRTYTQLEFDIARELKLPLYIFLCEPGYPFDAHAPEPADLAQLQQAHRLRITQGDFLYTPVSTP